ncbi:hypothetical protein KGQ55_02440 [Patescibacteria group bacterium]|nr:hypothetical protein [Patescibacteria group bacterium]
MHAAHIHAKTWQRGERTDVTVSSLEWPRFIDVMPTRILAVDDVVSSGTTLALVHERTVWRFPRARTEWHAAAWVTRKVKLAGYASVTAALHVVCEEGGFRPPINSLSTLLAECDIAESYACRHFGTEAGEFSTRLECIRNQ